ncbi:protein of unknown function [Cupriavidus taiwanensis]|uniref:hypothetical protein n=1 Tax=Cupriavidus taiwanensis TaxID=164546 RepID=UPI000E108D02|nr:hypothetical protein [Cupriavidus taiwanensis]SPA42977.1 protein of unknown function [Cupriavidus taiwanensis]
MRGKFGAHTVALERRLLMLFALRKGRLSLEAMREEAVISKEAFNQIAQVIQHAWNASLVRPPLRDVTEAAAGPGMARDRSRKAGCQAWRQEGSLVRVRETAAMMPMPSTIRQAMPI